MNSNFVTEKIEFMRSTFRVLFYTKNQAIKNGRVPVMGRITVNGTTASFSCKRDVPLSLWDAKGNCAKGKSEEARRLLSARLTAVQDKYDEAQGVVELYHALGGGLE